jgi:hypothetical protein
MKYLHKGAAKSKKRGEDKELTAKTEMTENKVLKNP